MPSEIVQGVVDARDALGACRVQVGHACAHTKKHSCHLCVQHAGHAVDGRVGWAWSSDAGKSARNYSSLAVEDAPGSAAEPPCWLAAGTMGSSARSMMAVNCRQRGA